MSRLHPTKIIASLLVLAVGLFATVGQATAAACSTTGNDTLLTLTGTSCSLGETVLGADGGTVAIGDNTSVTLLGGQTLTYTTSLTIGTNSTVAIAKTSGGAKIRKGYIYVTDADADGYRLNSSTDAVFSNVAVPGKVRKSAATSGLDANDGQFCSSGYAGYTCYTCASGAKALVANGADTLNHCTAAGFNGCTNICVKSTTNTGNCNGAGACATSTANVAAGKYCSGGSEVVGACAVGYTCNGSGGCCYTDIYGEHCL